MITVEEIVNHYDDRTGERGPLIEEMREVRDQYNGDVTVPLPELEPDEKPAIANLLNQGLDQTAMRVSSTKPDISIPPTKLGSKPALDLAAAKRRALLGIWDANYMDVLDGRRARHLVGYGSTACLLFPDMNQHLVKWQIIDPLDCLPGTTLNPDDPSPDDAIIVKTRAGGDIPGFEGEQTPWVDDDQCQVITWYDEHEIVQVAVGGVDRQRRIGGPVTINGHVVSGVYAGQGKTIISDGQHGTRYAYVISRIPNRVGRNPITMPNRITLERIASQFAQLTGMYQMQALLMAMEAQAVKHAVYPDEWIIERPGGNLDVVTMANGRRGVVGQIKDGSLQVSNPQPSIQTYQTMDRLERAQRINANMPSEYTGESGTNIRTGRRGDSIFSSVVDFTIREAQVVLARAKQEELVIAQEMYKAFWGTRTLSVKTPSGPQEFTPRKHFADTYVNVRYAAPGTDVNSLNVALGQLTGSDFISVHTGRTLHPLIDDPEEEERRVTAEGLKRAILNSFEQQIIAGPAQGGVSLEAAAWISDQVENNKMTFQEAIAAAHKREQEKQASSGLPGTPTGPQDPTSPQAQPGLQAGTSVPPPIPAPTPGTDNAVHTLRALATFHRAANAVTS